MRRLRRALTTAALLAVVAGAAVGCGGDGGDRPVETPAVVLPTGGETTLRLGPDLTAALADELITVLPHSPATAGDAGISFPIDGGSLASESLAGGIHHRGGLVFASGDAELVLTAIVLDGTGQRVTTIAGGGPLPFLDLDLAGLARGADAGVVEFTGIRARLSAEGATALNDTFGVDAFREGLAVGDLTIRPRV